MIRNLAATGFLLGPLSLAACGMNGDSTTSRPEAAVQQPATTQASAPGESVTPAASQSAAAVLQAPGQSAESLDTTTAEEKAAAAAPATGGGRLGTTVASLGDVTESGFWLKTPLVSATAQGRVVNTENSQSANVELRPLSGGGSGSQISLAAMQAIGAGLTDLPELEVWQN
ncbi:hypothetical protein [Paracoccus aerodenitrificans]|uniref:hypothetical protein n=1 Tax=Paracoccus aerodenitrificans TaxID=3017781 RepID=UPI0022EFE3A4|nr:hypothetical protein [Paracoccus aerodenitrificans]WBU63227.1 hypothetical protein PAE61_12770 [Paracoccus aerodenitrificans]